jgi:hypothetical protein
LRRCSGHLTPSQMRRMALFVNPTLIQRETVALVARACLADPQGKGNVTLETLTSLTEKAVARAAAEAAKASTGSLTKRCGLLVCRMEDACSAVGLGTKNRWGSEQSRRLHRECIVQHGGNLSVKWSPPGTGATSDMYRHRTR